MRSLVRGFAVVLLAGQLAQWPVAAWCAERHRQPASHCTQPASSADPTIGPLQAGSPGSCALAGPCAPLAPAAVARMAGNGLLFVVTHAAVVSPCAALRSFHPVPIPPPPQS
jgi:hypothetical protein